MMAVCLQDLTKSCVLRGASSMRRCILTESSPRGCGSKAAMNAMFTQRHQLEKSTLRAEAAQKSCVTMMNALSEHVQYENSAMLFRCAFPQAKDRKQQPDWAIAYRRSRLTMNRAQLIDDFKFPDCTDKKWRYKTPDSWTAEDKYLLLLALTQPLQARSTAASRGSRVQRSGTSSRVMLWRTASEGKRRVIVSTV